MASAYSDLLRLEKIATGEQNNSWGTSLNASFLEMIEEAVAGRAAVTHSDAASYTLTTANGSTDEARNMILNIGGALGAARNTVCPTSSKLYVVKNATTGGFATTLKTAAGTGISIPNGKTTLLFCDGTNVVDAIDYLSSLTIGGALTVTGVAALNNGTTSTATGYVYDSTGTTTTGRFARLGNTSGSITIGVESSAGGSALSASPAYSGVLFTPDNQPLYIGTNNTIRAKVNAGVGIVLAPNTGIPAEGLAGLGWMFSSTANFGVFFGSSAPTLSAAKGSLYLRSDGSGTGDRAYINTNGGTTWTALTTAA